MSGHTFDDLLDDFDPSDLLGTGAVDEHEDEDEGSSALRHVADKISAQYGEIIATWSGKVLSSTDPVKTAGVEATVENLLRLARSSGHQAQVVLLESLAETLRLIEDTTPNTRNGDQARVQLRDWIPSFADTLDGEDAERLRSLVEWTPGSVPFLEELKEIHGIGPRRLTRLYSAGLGQLDVVANATPKDLVDVTGIPHHLAVEVIQRAHTYAQEERDRCVVDIRDRAARLEMLLTRVKGHPDQSLVDAARDALRHVEDAFQTLLAKLPAKETP